MKSISWDSPFNKYFLPGSQTRGAGHLGHPGIFSQVRDSELQYWVSGSQSLGHTGGVLGGQTFSTHTLSALHFSKDLQSHLKGMQTPRMHLSLASQGGKHTLPCDSGVLSSPAIVVASAGWHTVKKNLRKFLDFYDQTFLVLGKIYVDKNIF